MTEWVKEVSRTSLDGEFTKSVCNHGKIIKTIYYKSGIYKGEKKEVHTDKIILKRTRLRDRLSKWIPIINGKLDHDQVRYVSTYNIVKDPPKESYGNYLMQPIPDDYYDN